jgi:4-carboxymuconolactone decarboxylase
LGADYVDPSIQRADDFMAAFQQLTTEVCWGMVWTRPGLDRKTRSLLNLAMLSVLNRAPELRLHTRAAVLSNGVTPDEVKEVFLQVGAYCGIPAALESFKVGAEVLKEIGASSSSGTSSPATTPPSSSAASSVPDRVEYSSDLFRRGLQIRREVLGAAYVDPSLQKADDFMAAFQQLTTEVCWGMVWTRPGLDRKTRSLLNLVMLAALNRAPELRLHTRAAVLSNGVTRDEVKEVFLQVGAYCGIPAALESFKVGAEVFKEIDNQSPPSSSSSTFSGNQS